ncbi:MAG: DegT/DnrJ/EryC1/StrS family aminotransferase [Spirochaetota bacterium]
MSMIPWAKPLFFEKEKKYLAQALDSTWISHGPFVEQFENEFLTWHGASYGITTSNGTTALQLALLGAGVGPGDEVIVPGFTFVAAGNMAIAVGAKPLFVEVDPETWCIDPTRIERAITPRTKAIIPVHLYGNVCDMDAIMEIAAKHKLFVIEDNAEAAFSKYKGRYAGTIGDIGCFSFQATKTITMGEGGFVISRDKAVHERMRVIRDHGMRKGKRYWHDVVGFNFRVTNMQAAVGCGQLARAKTIIEKKKQMYEWYRERLTNQSGIILQAIRDDVDPVIWAVALRVNEAVFQRTRDEIIEALLAADIETRPGFYPFSVLPLYQAQPMPICEEIGAHVLSLPSFPQLTEKEIGHICDVLIGLRK